MEPPIPLDRWRPLPLSDLVALLEAAPFRWGLAGGYALELFMGHPVREHGDVEIAVLRADQRLVQRWLDDWQLYVVDPPGALRPWAPEEQLGPEQHELWGHRRGADSWELEVLMEQTSGDLWLWRRDERVREPLSWLFVRYGGVPCVRAEIQLLYKARARRPKDDVDFAACLPVLGAAARDWLRERITLIYGAAHPWAAQLRAATDAETHSG